MTEVRDPWRWRPLTGIPPDAHEWLAPSTIDLKDRREGRSRTASHRRRQGVRRRDGAMLSPADRGRGAHRGRRLRGLLADQDAAHVVYRDTAADAEITAGMLKRWMPCWSGTRKPLIADAWGRFRSPRRVLGRRSRTTPSKGVFDAGGSRWTVRPLRPNPSRATTVHAAWLHHRFVHPFQDGMGVPPADGVVLLAAGPGPAAVAGRGPRGLLRCPATGRCRGSQELLEVPSRCRRRPPSSRRTRRHRTASPAGWRIRQPTAHARSARPITSRRSGASYAARSALASS